MPCIFNSSIAIASFGKAAKQSDFPAQLTHRRFIRAYNIICSIRNADGANMDLPRVVISFVALTIFQIRHRGDAIGNLIHDYRFSILICHPYSVN